MLMYINIFSVLEYQQQNVGGRFLKNSPNGKRKNVKVTEMVHQIAILEAKSRDRTKKNVTEYHPKHRFKTQDNNKL